MNDSEKFQEACVIIGLEYYQHIEDMASEHERWSYCDDGDKMRASALYRVAFKEGWNVEDCEDKIQDDFYRACAEYIRCGADDDTDTMAEILRWEDESPGAA